MPKTKRSRTFFPGRCHCPGGCRGRRAVGDCGAVAEGLEGPHLPWHVEPQNRWCSRLRQGPMWIMLLGAILSYYIFIWFSILTTICFFSMEYCKVHGHSGIWSRHMKRIHSCDVRIPRHLKKLIIQNRRGPLSLEHSFGNLSSLHLQLRVHCKTTAHTVVRCRKYCAVYHDLPYRHWHETKPRTGAISPDSQIILLGALRGWRHAIYTVICSCPGWGFQGKSYCYTSMVGPKWIHPVSACLESNVNGSDLWMPIFWFDIFSPCTHIYIYILHIYYSIYICTWHLLLLCHALGLLFLVNQHRRDMKLLSPWCWNTVPILIAPLGEERVTVGSTGIS